MGVKITKEHQERTDLTRNDFVPRLNHTIAPT